jgi:predicted Zn-dependent peptidase
MNAHTVGFILRPDSQKKEKPPSQVPRLIVEKSVSEKSSTVIPSKTEGQNAVATAVLVNDFQAYQKILPNTELLGINWQFPTASLNLNQKMSLSLLQNLWLKSPLKEKSEHTIQAYLDALGVSVSFQVEEDWVTVYFETTSDNVSTLLEAQRLILLHQQGLAFDEESFELERQNAMQSIRILEANPQGLLFAHANQRLAKGQLKGLQLEERREALNALRFEEIKTTWLNLWGNAPVAVIMAGREDSLEALQSGLRFNALLKGHHAIKETPLLKRDSKSNASSLKPIMELQTVHVPKEDQATTWLLWGWQLPAVQDADMTALHLLQTYLGQGMDSVLFQEVREKRGLAYEVSSQLDTQLAQSRLLWHAGVKPENVAETNAIFQSVLERLASTPLSVDELNALKAKRLGRFEIALNTPEQWTNFAGKILIQGFSLDYLERYREQLEAVTPSDLQRVARQYLGKAPHLKLSLGKSQVQSSTKEQTPHAR